MFLELLLELNIEQFALSYIVVVSAVLKKSSLVFEVLYVGCGHLFFSFLHDVQVVHDFNLVYFLQLWEVS